MEQKLTKLFDFQRFEKNAHLEAVIRSAEADYASELSDDELSWVAAAGDRADRMNMKEGGEL